jgi:hypothetical protein
LEQCSYENWRKQQQIDSNEHIQNAAVTTSSNEFLQQEKQQKDNQTSSLQNLSIPYFLKESTKKDYNIGAGLVEPRMNRFFSWIPLCIPNGEL